MAHALHRRPAVQAGLRAKPEIGLQFGAGGDSSPAELAAEGTLDPAWAVRKAKRCLDAGAQLIMIESKGAPAWCKGLGQSWLHSPSPPPTAAGTRGCAAALGGAGITEDVEEWRTDVAARFLDALGEERVMFEAADPKVFS